LAQHELAAIGPLQSVFRVNMVMAELWTGQRTGAFERLALTVASIALGVCRR
jgi:hypothetical protein